MPPKRRSRSRSPYTKRKTSRARSATPKRAPTPARRRSSDALALAQPPTEGYEWGGPLGAAALVVFLPTLVFTLTALARSPEAHIADSLRALPQLLRHTLSEAVAHLAPLLVIELLWLAAHAVFSVLPIGRLVEGTELRTGGRLTYRINAAHALVVSHAALAYLHYAGAIDLVYLAERLPSAMLAAIVIAAAMSVALLAASYRKGVVTALGGNTPSLVYNFWIGRELNPRTGPLDWKLMTELRPGLIGWSVLNWACVLQARRLGTFTPSIALIAAAESFYVLDGLFLEAGNLTMMDIVRDGFGFMLCFGDLAWVPFTYTLQTQYLARHPTNVPAAWRVACVALCAAGYVLFRHANMQKDRFRKNPQDPRVAHLQTYQTRRGTALLVSGVWGACRHPNYVGDWLMALSWALLAGPAPIAYFHPIYFGILLVHRQFRDEQAMREKYGERDWAEFCRRVPARLIPGVY